MGCYVWYSEEGTGRGFRPWPRDVSLWPVYHSPYCRLVIRCCGFDVAVKGLKGGTRYLYCCGFDVAVKGSKGGTRYLYCCGFDVAVKGLKGGTRYLYCWCWFEVNKLLQQIV